MFTNHHYHPGLTQEAHRALPFISNTDLTETKNRALGITRQPNPQALLFGSHFHTAVLEPDQYQRTPQRVPWAQIEDLAAAVRRQRFCRDLLYRGQAEQTHTATHKATHKATGLVVKVRSDLMITRGPLWGKNRPRGARGLQNHQRPGLRPFRRHHRAVRLRPPGRPIFRLVRSRPLYHHRGSEEKCA